MTNRHVIGIRISLSQHPPARDRKMPVGSESAAPRPRNSRNTVYKRQRERTKRYVHGQRLAIEREAKAAGTFSNKHLGPLGSIHLDKARPQDNDPRATTWRVMSLPRPTTLPAWFKTNHPAVNLWASSYGLRAFFTSPRRLIRSSTNELLIDLLVTRENGIVAFEASRVGVKRSDWVNRVISIVWEMGIERSV